MNPTLPLTSFLISSSDPGYVSSSDKERVIYNSVPRLIFRGEKKKKREKSQRQENAIKHKQEAGSEWNITSMLLEPQWDLIKIPHFHVLGVFL